MTLSILIDGKPRNLTEPWSIAFDLDDDARININGEHHDLPAGATLVWTGGELYWYPASHSVRQLVRSGARGPLRFQEGGHRLWPTN